MIIINKPCLYFLATAIIIGANFSFINTINANKSRTIKEELIWPSDIHRKLDTLGSLVYVPENLDSRNIRKIVLKPEYLDNESGWFYETFKLEVYFNDVTEKTKFNAKNGNFQVSVPASLWGKIRSYILLIRQSSKGTGVSEYELRVIHASGEKLKTVITKKVAGFFDLFGNSWRYDIRLTPTGIESENKIMGLEFLYHREFAAEEFVHKGLVKKDAEYGQDMPKVICVLARDNILREFEGKRCQDIRHFD